MEFPRHPWFRFGLAALTGACWALAFPSSNLAGLAWIAPGALMFVGVGLGEGSGLRTVYVAAAVHYLISLSWLRFIPFPAGAYTGWLALSFFLALFPPLWVWTCWRIGRRCHWVPGCTSSPSQVAEALSTVAWWRLNAWFLLCGVSWVAWEMLLARMFGGFPWNLLGVSQYRILPLIQISTVTGVYGVSFLVVWFSVALVTAAFVLLRHPDRPGTWRRPLILPGVTLVAIMGGGFLAILGDQPAPRRLSVALVQPAIPQTVIFDPSASTNRFETLLALTEQALAKKPELVVWPEASLPGGLGREEFDRLVQAVRAAGSWFVFGSDEVESSDPVAGGAAEGTEHYYNAAFLVNPQGEMSGTYRKRRLVMFGEYVPFGRWLPFLQRLAPIGAGFEAGTRPVPFHLGSLDVTLSALICFEDNFPQIAQEHAAPGTDFLLNLTNDAWFGRSSAQWQHAANASFRAIENGLPLVRCSNNGISCWIDRRGRFHSPRLVEGRDMYDAGFDLVNVEYGQPGRTFYNRFGDVFGWCCVAVTLAGLGQEIVSLTRRRAREGAKPRSRKDGEGVE